VNISIEELSSPKFVANKLERKNIKGNDVRLEGRLDEIRSNQIVVAGIVIDIPDTAQVKLDFKTGIVVKIKGTYDVSTEIFTAIEVRD